MSLLGDIYYKRDYVALYKKEDESIFEFEFKEDESYFYNIALKRPIKHIGAIAVDEGYYDLETAYGYGGYLTNSVDIHFIERAFAAYKQHCLSERIIAEFIRFNPLNYFAYEFSEIFDFIAIDRNTIITDGFDYIGISSGYSKSLKRDLKVAGRNSLFFYEVFDNKCDYSRIFMELYLKTMKINNASSFYCFDIEYFSKLLGIENSHLFIVEYDGKIINMVIMLYGCECAYYHLAATDPNYYYLNSNKFILDEIIKNVISSGKNVYLGGGLSSDINDSLYLFKKRFSNKQLPFYIAGNVYNRDVYDRYVKTFDQQMPQSMRYFLKYRLKIGS